MSDIRSRLAACVLLLVLVAFGERPSQWAVRLDVPGVPNLYKVSDTLYRSAQPTAEGFRELEKLGIQTVICLRTTEKDSALCRGTGLKVWHFPLTPVTISERDILEILKILCDRASGPCLIHCQHGADRTGTLCAAFRLCVEGWTAEEAVREMTEGGFGFHSFLVLLPRTIRRLDAEGMRCQLKLKAKPANAEVPR